MKTLCSIILLITQSGFTLALDEYDIFFDEDNPRIAFAAQEIQHVLEDLEMPQGGLSVQLKEDKSLGSQAYRITFPEKGVLLVEGGDDAGLMIAPG